MLGAIVGDIAGSVYERFNHPSLDVELFVPGSRFTDDTVLTVATAEVLLRGGDYAEAYQCYGRRYPRAGYGQTFIQWIFADAPQPYNSWGNGSAMRASPIGWACDSPDAVLAEAARSASVTHNHPEGIKGAQAAALAVYLARTGHSKEIIRDEITARFGYDLTRRTDDIRPTYRFDVSCQGSVPEAIIAFLESRDFEEALRLAISLGGDSDTIACIAGGIAHAFYGSMPAEFIAEARRLLPADLLQIADEFSARHVPRPA